MTKSSLGIVSMSLTAFLALGNALLAQAPPEKVPWKSLEFRARKLGFSMSASLELGSKSADEAAKDLVETPEGRALSPTGEVTSLRLRTSFAGRHSDSTTLFDAQTSRSFQQQQLDSGRRDRYRVNRYGGDGVFTLRRVPEAGQESQPHDNWTGGSPSWSPYPDWAGDDLAVADAGSLFYLAAAAPLRKPGDRYQVPVFSRGNLILIEMTVKEVEAVRVDYEKVSGTGSQRVKTRVQGLRISLDAQHLDPDSEEDDLELMGLRGDVVMTLDPQTRLPLELSGRVPIAGGVRVRLSKAKFE